MTIGPEEARAEPDLLELIGIKKQFVATLALDGVDLAIGRGEIHALLGQNGAGKSTLIKVLAGIYPPTAGVVKWRGEVVEPTSARLPITFIHQDLGLVDSMTVAENVALLAGYPQRGPIIQWKAAAAAARAALRLMESDIDPDLRVGSLSAAEKSIVAIARALAHKSDILVLDEPTAALPAADVDLLLDKLLRLKASGIGLLYVTHRLDEVFRIADRVTVLRDGRRVAVRSVSGTKQSELVEWIVGGALAATDFATVPSSAETLLGVERWSCRRRTGPGSRVRSRSRCTAAKRSVWSGCAGPATMPSVARSSAPCRPNPDRSASRAARSNLPVRRQRWMLASASFPAGAARKASQAS